MQKIEIRWFWRISIFLNINYWNFLNLKSNDCVWMDLLAEKAFLYYNENIKIAVRFLCCLMEETYEGYRKKDS